MKKIVLIILWSFSFLPITHAAYFNFVPQTKVQPNGDTLRCFATGDEYFHRLHDANNYTIVLDPATGYYVYADKVGDKLVPTSYVAGRVNPAEAGLIPGLSISAEQWRARRQRWEVPTPPHYRSNTRLGNRQANRGHINNIVIFIRFADDPEFTTPFSSVNNMFNDSTAGHSSLYNYFKTVSYNQLFISSTYYPAQSGYHIISYQDIFNRSYFEPYSNNNPQGYATNDDDAERTAREHALLTRAVNAVSSNIPSNLEIDYDNDDYVDNVVFVVRGNVGSWNDLLWPHRWSLYTEEAYINGKRVYDYNFQLADATSYFNTSILCHEMNHTLGAPDLYHYYEGTNMTPVDMWDLMHQNTNPPQHMGAYMKYHYGHWIDSIPEITECGTYSLHSVGSSATNNCYKLASPNANEFFVLEYRNTNDLFEGTLPSSGLLVYRINTDFNGNSMWNGVDIFDEVYIYRPDGTISQNGDINNAAFGSNFGRTEMNANTNPQPFLTDGTVVDAGSFTIREISVAGEDSITFTICRVPITVTTASVTGITLTTASCGGTVSDDGGNAVTARGVCWSTSQNPTIADNHTIDGSGSGSFTSYLTGLIPNTSYYVRAYATTSVGTAYGEEVDFTTPVDPNGDSLSCPGTATVTDRDGNVYNTVQIGEQCWMRENLHTTQYANGTAIAYGTSVSTEEAYYYYPYIQSENVSTYGMLYNWKAAMGDTSSATLNHNHIQGICPDGWHIPSDAEWTQLADYVSSQSQYWCGDNSTYIAKALASTDNWTNNSYACAVGNMPSDNNATGFSVPPAGYCDIQSIYWDFYGASYFWSSTEYSITTAFVHFLYYTSPQINRSYMNKGNGCSIRCLRDETEVDYQLPTVSTVYMNEFTDTSVNCHATITSNGGSEITARGICWGTAPSPTINSNHTTAGSGIGSFSSIITGLIPGTTYYIRAYASNAMGTAYGMEVTFAPSEISEGDGEPCSGVATVTDYDGNIYNTVKIGNQCWMRENLRTLHYADGTDITSSASIYGGASYSYPYVDSSIISTYGLLYNWPAIMGNYFASDYNPSGVQGICPEGWHVPSDGEWYQLVSYVRSKPQYRCDYSSSGSIAKALAATSGWRNSDMICTVGNNQSENNATGFSALPFDMEGYKVTYWCSSMFNSHAEAYTMRCTESFVDNSVVYNLPMKFVVRCVYGAGVALPTVSTSEVDNITYTSATCGGNASTDNGGTIIAKGVCWSISHNPTTNDSHTSDGGGAGNFTSILTGLSSNHTYYVRAYVTNQYGTVYGEEISFTTPFNSDGDEFSCLGAISVTDQDGNIYNTVQIGGQCWMRENLRVTQYADGTIIEQGNSNSNTTGYWYYPDNSITNGQTYGLLYNWSAVMGTSSSSNATPSGVQGICPNGWHVPSDAEWKQLTDYVSSQSEYSCNNSSVYIAKALATATGWENFPSACCVGYNQTNNNATGFSALPAGDNWNHELGYTSYFWSTTEQNSSNAYNRYLSYSDKEVYRNNIYKERGYSVRCIRNEGQTLYFPTVVIDSVTDITSSSATIDGSIITSNIVNVTVRGICWSTSQNPTTEDTHTTDSSNSGNFTCNLSGLISNHTYYARAYATNQYGTVYSNEVNFTTPISSDGDILSCPGAPTLTDHEGNLYNTIQIGGQCWMRENLRATQYADGTAIAQSDGTTYMTDYWYDPSEDINDRQTYGLLYSWSAIMHGATSTSTIPSGVQGICPNGWHVPSDGEWTLLTDYVSNQSEYLCGEYSAYIAKALASTTDWNDSYNSYCSPGYLTSDNNATGFCALPVGYCYNSENYGSFGYSAYFWSATEQNASSAYHRQLVYYYHSVERDKSNKEWGCSVRCLRDEGQSQYFPAVTTDSVNDITANTATCGSNVSATDGIEVTARGVCWSTNHYPTTTDSHTIDGSDTGSFSSNLTGLISNFTYYVRAYATNQYGTIYGNEVSFTTPVNPNGDELSCLGAHTLTDGDGNVYNTVQIGGQCWMRENLRSTQYADGTAIAQGGEYSYTMGYWKYPNNDINYNKAYGLLYNWPAIMHGAASTNATPSGVQGICPNGWHVPSNAEWTQLTDYVNSQNEYLCDNNDSYIAKALASTTGWYDNYAYCTPSYLPSDNNVTGFGILPVGYYTNSTTYGFGENASLWSATELNDSYAYYLFIAGTSNEVYQYTNSKHCGQSLRCLKDEGQSQYFPTVITDSITDIAATAATCGGNIINDGGSNIITRGVYWSTSPTLTISDSHTNDGSGAGNFSSNIMNLHPNTTYYVRAYATNYSGTSYGDTMIFTTPCDTVNINISGTTTINYGQNATLTASGAESYIWSSNADSATTASVIVSPTVTTTYNVTGTNQYGCSTTVSVTVIVNIIAPSITTNDITDIDSVTATCGGNVIHDGGASVIDCGVCWSTSQNPTTADNHTNDDNGTGSFFSNITGLSPNTTYYVRAYATNSAGIGYGEQKVFTTSCNTVNFSISGTTTIIHGQSTTLTASGANSYLWSESAGNATTDTVTVSPAYTTTYTVIGVNQYGCSATASITVAVTSIAPTVITNNITNITATTATCGGNVTNDGGANIIECGLCWSTSQNPTIADSHTNNGSGTGSFFSIISGLFPNTTYYVRAYATNNAGISYGNEVSFTTLCNMISDTINASICIGDNYIFCNITLTEAGTYSHTSTMANGCDSITILNLTVLYGTHNVTTVSECESYTWTAGTGETYTESGIYIHYYDDIDGCPSADTLHLTITPVGINDYTSATNFHISSYPNPTHQSVNVKISDSSIPISKAELYDAMGRKIKVSSWPDKNSTQQIELKECAPGLYFIKLYNETNYLGTTKIIKQ